MDRDFAYSSELRDKLDFHREYLLGEQCPIDFIKTTFGVDNLEEKLREDPQKWIHELESIMMILDPLNGGLGESLFPVPKEYDGWNQISPSVGIYTGEHFRGHGLWVAKKYEVDIPDQRVDDEGNLWMQLQMKNRGVFQGFFSDMVINTDDFSHAKFKSGEELTHYKRDIRGFTSNNIEVVAKECVREMGFFHDESKPWYRQTNLASFNTSSELPYEVKLGLWLYDNDVAVPKTLGRYSEILQEYSFYERIAGVDAKQMMSESLPRFLHQDAIILARLLKSGFHKQGFTDTDDKIYDGSNLWLVDWDECVPIDSSPTLTSSFINPSHTSRANKYREMQQNIYEMHLEMTVTDYNKKWDIPLKDLQLYRDSFTAEMQTRE